LVCLSWFVGGFGWVILVGFVGGGLVCGWLVG